MHQDQLLPKQNPGRWHRPNMQNMWAISKKQLTTLPPNALNLPRVHTMTQ